MKFQDEFKITAHLLEEAAKKGQNLQLSADGFYKSILIVLAMAHIDQTLHVYDRNHFVDLAGAMYDYAHEMIEI